MVPMHHGPNSHKKKLIFFCPGNKNNFHPKSKCKSNFLEDRWSFVCHVKTKPFLGKLVKNILNTKICINFAKTRQKNIIIKSCAELNCVRLNLKEAEFWKNAISAFLVSAIWAFLILFFYHLDQIKKPLTVFAPAYLSISSNREGDI